MNNFEKYQEIIYTLPPLYRYYDHTEGRSICFPVGSYYFIKNTNKKSLFINNSNNETLKILKKDEIVKISVIGIGEDNIEWLIENYEESESEKKEMRWHFKQLSDNRKNK
jgi:hypothetical protein